MALESFILHLLLLGVRDFGHNCCGAYVCAMFLLIVKLNGFILCIVLVAVKNIYGTCSSCVVYALTMPLDLTHSLKASHVSNIMIGE